MKKEIITEELAKLLKRQGYLEDSLECYITLHKSTGKLKFLKAAKEIRNIIKPVNSSGENMDSGKSARVSELLEQLLDMVILEKKIHSFKKIHNNQE